MSSDLLDKSKEGQVVDCESSSVGDLLKKWPSESCSCERAVAG